MKVILQKGNFSSLIGKIHNVVPNRPVIPALVNALLEAEEDHLAITVTDLTVSVRCLCPAVVLKKGSVTLLARLFFQLIRGLSVSEIVIEVDENFVVNISNGPAFFRIHGTNRDQFPEFPEICRGIHINVPGDKLKGMFANTIFSAARDESRSVLNCAHLEVENNQMTLVATDGKRLAKIEEVLQKEILEPKSCIIPLKGAEEIIRILEEEKGMVSVIVSPEKLFIITDSMTFVSKLFMGKFPDYKNIMPIHEDMPFKIAIHRDEFMLLLKQLFPFAPPHGFSVRLTFENGELCLQAVNSEVGEGRVTMPVDYHDKKMEIAFNPSYFLDILRRCKNEVVNFGMKDSFNLGSIVDEPNKHYILMPMRLQSE